MRGELNARSSVSRCDQSVCFVRGGAVWQLSSSIVITVLILLCCWHCSLLYVGSFDMMNEIRVSRRPTFVLARVFFHFFTNPNSAFFITSFRNPNSSTWTRFDFGDSLLLDYFCWHVKRTEQLCLFQCALASNYMNISIMVSWCFAPPLFLKPHARRCFLFVCDLDTLWGRCNKERFIILRNTCK